MAGRARDGRIDDAIVAMAEEQVAEVGYAGFSVELLSERLGIAKSTIYNRWPSRRALLVAVLAQIRRGRVPAGEAADELSPRDRLIEAARAELALVATREGRAIALGVLEALDTGDAGGRPLLAAVRERREGFLALVRQAVEAGGPGTGEDDLGLVVGVLSSLAWGALLTGDPIPPDAAERIVDAALRLAGQ